MPKYHPVALKVLGPHTAFSDNSLVGGIGVTFYILVRVEVYVPHLAFAGAVAIVFFYDICWSREVIV